MTYRYFRRRAQTVSLGTAQVPSINASDSIDAQILTWGATTPSLPSSVPPGGVRRLLSLGEVAHDPLAWRKLRGMGTEPGPHARPRLRSPVVRVGPSVGVRRLAPPRLLQAQRRAESWRLFRQLQVRRPSRDVLCVRRLQRKQVLFAKRVAGRSGGSPGPYRRTVFSQWRC